MHTVLTELETTDIPLHKLRAWEGNVRVTRTDRRLDELTASIAAHGVLHSLVVQKKGRGLFTVIAGRRRLWALTRLAETGAIPRTYPVPCRVAPAEADPTEISLAENVEHEPMHPADEFEAFQKLIGQGQSAADVAARFGVSEDVVQKRLALARVSPKLLAKYRAGEMNLELLQAFTLTDDHTRQEELWESLPAWNRNAAAIRRFLSEADLPATDRRVRFVGLAAYEAAGGRVRRNLFAEGEEGVSLLDADLLLRLTDTKLTDLAEQVKADGWKWVAVEPEATYETLSRYRRVSAPEAPWTPEEETHLETLQEKRRALEEQLAEEAEEEEQEPLYRRLEEIDRAVQSFTRHRKRIYSDLQKANSGVLVSIGFEGEPEYVYGLLRKEDEQALQSPAQTSEHTEEEPAHSSFTPPAAPEKDGKEVAAYSAALIESLTTHKAAALAAELTQ
jgi:ParB family transcriptional regulator, chromosome partitioning protein